MTQQAMTESEVVIWYRPRIRLWKDHSGEWHLAGEPDGAANVVAAFRRVARGIAENAEVELRTDPIPPDRNPVVDRGISSIFEKLTFERVIVGKGEAIPPPRISDRGRAAQMQFSELTKAMIGFALCELLDGEGDFNIRVVDDTNQMTRLWFWGYSNPHGVNSF
jgi:hypothetical protein